MALNLGIGSTTTVSVNETGGSVVSPSVSVAVSVYVVRGWSSVGVPVMVPLFVSVGRVYVNPTGKVVGVSA